MRIRRLILWITIASSGLAMVSCHTTGVSSGFEEGDIALSIGVVSDVHINTALPVTSAKWKSALEQLSVKALEQDVDGLDGVLVAGDLIDYPNEAFINEFKKVYESVLDPSSVPLIYTVGNHDVPQYKWSETMVEDAKYIRKALGDNYFLTDVDIASGEGLECRHCKVRDYDIIAVSPDGTSPVKYSPEALKWLDSTLSEITEKEPSRYVMVITHPMLYDTVYGSLLGESYGIWKSYSPGYWASRELPEILSKYPQAVTFGGHLHFPLNDPRSVWQGGFTALGCGSVRYMAIEAGGYEDMAGQTTMKDKDEFSQGLLVQFDKKGNMRIFRMDFYNKSVIGEPLEMVRPRKDGRHLEPYSFELRKSVNEPPVLSTMDVAPAKTPEPWRKDKPAGISVNFPSGTDDEFVHHYEVTLSSAGNLLVNKKILADFYKCPLPSMMKSSWTVTFSPEDLPEEYLDTDTSGHLVVKAGKYAVSLVAYDSWDVSSDALSKEISLP